MKSKATAIVQHLPITKARINLGQLARRVRLHKEYFILEKDGLPVIGLMDPDELEDYLELRNPKVRTQIRASHQEYLAGRHRAARAVLAELEAPRPAARKAGRAKA